jgi:hypothetical protein
MSVGTFFRVLTFAGLNGRFFGKLNRAGATKPPIADAENLACAFSAPTFGIINTSLIVSAMPHPEAKARYGKYLFKKKKNAGRLVA